VTSVENKRPRGRPRAADADDKRKEILARAAALFAQHGFNKTPFASVAQDMNMTLPGLTYHFPRKIDLLLAVLEDRDKELFPDGYPAHEDDPFAVLHRLMMRDTGKGAQLTRLFHVLSTEALSEQHPAHDWFRQRFDKIASALEGALRHHQQNGVIDPQVDCAVETEALLAMMEGLQLRWLRSPDTVDPVRIFQRYLAAVRHRTLASPEV